MFLKLFLVFVLVLVTAEHPKRAKSRHEKRAVGLVPLVAGAVANGIIGATIGNMMTYLEQPKGPLSGDCDWFGSSPFCNGICPPSYEFIETSQKSNDSFFGNGCTEGWKRKCCRSASGDCSWSGFWMSSRHMIQYQCQFETYYNSHLNASRRHMGEHGPQMAIDTHRCGFFRCTDKNDAYDKSRRKIVHKSPGLCNSFKFEERNHKNETREIEARAICGIIAFYHADEYLDTWFKM